MCPTCFLYFNTTLPIHYRICYVRFYEALALNGDERRAKSWFQTVVSTVTIFFLEHFRDVVKIRGMIFALLVMIGKHT